MQATAPQRTIYAYYDIDDREGLRRWFEAKPEGIWKIVIGVDDWTSYDGIASTLDLLAALSSVGFTEAEVRAGKQWLYDKIERDECVIKLDERMSIPSGSVEIVEA
jgi:hypothetical protein